MFIDIDSVFKDKGLILVSLVIRKYGKKIPFNKKNEFHCKFIDIKF